MEKTLVFATVIYEATNQEQYRVSVVRGGQATLIFQQETWTKLFDLIDKMYPGFEYEIPDEIDIIRFDKHYREVK